MTCRIKSIIQKDMNYCIVCGRFGAEVHHIFFGTANRTLSDKYGLVVGLCPYHHRSSHGVHGGNRDLDLELKKMGQEAFTKTFENMDFLAIFGRNYL